MATEEQCRKALFKNKFHDMFTWNYEFRPGNKSIWMAFDEESEFSGPRKPKMGLDQVVVEYVPYKNVVL